eukprot:2647780-Lingulodinium_polyedra.AAC.1
MGDDEARRRLHQRIDVRVAYGISHQLAKFLRHVGGRRVDKGGLGMAQDIDGSILASEFFD